MCLSNPDYQPLSTQQRAKAVQNMPKRSKKQECVFEGSEEPSQEENLGVSKYHGKHKARQKKEIYNQLKD